MSPEDVTAARRRALALMREPHFYPHRPASVELRETHISMVFIAGDRVYKVKKELSLPFLDYGTLERRRFYCEEEVRLNRRLARDTYLGVRSVVPNDRGFALGAPDDPAAVEYAVEMRRLPEQRTLAHLVATGEATEQTIESIARTIADFHREAAVSPPDYGRPEVVMAQIYENFTTLLPWVGRNVDRRDLEAVERYASTFVLNRLGLLEGRRAAGRVREGHGDLRAEHVVLEDGRVTIFDCVEFDARLRHIDVASDLAFLYMDLEWLGAAPLALALERVYVEASGDSELTRLIPFYACYRSCVRAKVACLRFAELGPGEPGRDRLLSEARGLLALARRLAWRSRLPLVLVFCGVGASGKSALAAQVSKVTGFLHLSSDALRKELAGIPVTARGGQEIYTDAFSVRTYARLIERARGEVEAGRGAILDATFLHRSHRQSLLEALRPLGARILFLECRAPMPLLRERALRRSEAPEHGSDATWEIVQTQIKRFQFLYDVPAEDHLVVRTDRPLEQAVDEVEAFASRTVEGRP